MTKTRKTGSAPSARRTATIYGYVGNNVGGAKRVRLFRTRALAKQAAAVPRFSDEWPRNYGPYPAYAFCLGGWRKGTGIRIKDLPAKRGIFKLTLTVGR
jgi:hypothetical protein